MSYRYFILTDETWVEINSPRREDNISQPKGANAYDYATHHKSPTIKVMFWACMAYEYKGPCYIWEQEFEEENIEHTKELKEVNETRKVHEKEHQARALIPGTAEHQILAELNANVV